MRQAALRHLAAARDGRASVVREGGLSACASALSRHAGCAAVRLHGTRLLAALAPADNHYFYDPDPPLWTLQHMSALVTGAADACEALIRAAAALTADTDVALYGCHILQYTTLLLKDDNVSAAVVQMIPAGITMAVGALEAHPGDRALARTACSALEGFVNYKRYAFAPAGVRAGGVHALLQALRVHGAEERVALPTVRALSCITITGSQRFAPAVAAAGGVELVVAALSTHAFVTHDDSFIFNACSLLSDVVECEGGRLTATVLASGAVEAVVRTLTLRPGMSGRSASQCMETLSSLALPRAPGGAEAVFDAGGDSAIVAAMAADPANAKVAAAGCNALNNLSAAWLSLYTPMVVQHGGLVAVVAAMRAHPTHFSVVNGGVGTLRGISFLFSSMVVSHGGVELVVRALLDPPPPDAKSKSIILENGCATLANIAGWTHVAGGEAAPAMVRAGAVRALRAAMAAGASDPAVAETACNALGGLAAWSGGSLVPAVASEGGVGAIIGAVEAHIGAPKVCALGLRAAAAIAAGGPQWLQAVSDAGAAAVAERARRTHPGDERVLGSCDALQAVLRQPGEGAGAGGGGGPA